MRCEIFQIQHSLFYHSTPKRPTPTLHSLFTYSLIQLLPPNYCLPSPDFPTFLLIDITHFVLLVSYFELIPSFPPSLFLILYLLFVIPSILIITAKFPPAICGVGDHSAGLRNYLQQNGHRVIIANGKVEDLQQAVYRYPEKSRADFLTALVQKENITHVLWQYSPYAMHAKGTPWWVLGAMRALRKTGVEQSIYFHEIQIRYSVPGWYDKLRAWQQHTIANRAVNICDRAGTSISFYLQYITAKRKSNSAKRISNSTALSAENLRLSAVKKMVLIPVPPNIPVHYKKIINLTNIEEISEKQNLPLKIRKHSSEFGHPSPLRRGEGGEVVAAFSNRAIPSIIEALARIQKANTTLEVVWLGHASETDMDALRKNSTRFGLNARITGAVPLDKLAEEIAQVDFIVLPQPLGAGNEGGISLKNGTLSAAMAAGKPIIATRGDMTDTGLLQHGNNIHLLQDNDVDTWQNAIEQLLQDADYRNRLSHAGHAFYTEHLCWDVVGKAFEGLILGE